ncbi:unnamed protein product [Rotaria sordida]|uniref:Uncharacterized protein n=1 Tax=Rotaria sordida TaxID=392033 RepID=A0A813TSW2_9BILA|nr:unnamed protein product [Rotaria sordida]
MQYTLEQITKTLLSRTPYPSLLAPPPSDPSKRVSSTPWNQTIHDDLLQLQKNPSIPVVIIHKERPVESVESKIFRP